MDLLSLVTLIALGVFTLNAQQQRRRVSLLARHVGQYQIEKLMQTLVEGYLRALGEADPARQAQVWQLLTASETALADQLGRLAAGFAAEDEQATRVSRLPVSLPQVNQWLPQTTFDLRRLLEIHAQGVARVVQGGNPADPKAKAFTLMAELFLFQHSCHWFCKSKTVATGRLLVRHQTHYEQALAAVSAPTRSAYRALTGT